MTDQRCGCCGGSGKVSFNYASEAMAYKNHARPCNDCNGTGFVSPKIDWKARAEKAELDLSSLQKRFDVLVDHYHAATAELGRQQDIEQLAKFIKDLQDNPERLEMIAR